jgi:PPOX class probable F420-dependent enzyme
MLGLPSVVRQAVCRAGSQDGAVPKLDQAECERRFKGARVATLATTNAQGGADLVPVTFIAGGDLVISAVDHKPKSTQRLARLRNIEARPRVALLAHNYSDEWDDLWWVRAAGRAHVEDEIPSGYFDVLASKYPPYAEQPPGGPFIVIQVKRWQGWAATDPAPSA